MYKTGDEAVIGSPTASERSVGTCSRASQARYKRLAAPDDADVLQRKVSVQLVTLLYLSVDLLFNLQILSSSK